jgi:hypothetical protein
MNLQGHYRRSSSAIPSTLFWAYDTISAKRRVYAECESSRPRDRFRLRSYMEGFRATEERIVYDVCVDGGVDTVGGG